MFMKLATSKFKSALGKEEWFIEKLKINSQWICGNDFLASRNKRP